MSQAIIPGPLARKADGKPPATRTTTLRLVFTLGVLLGINTMNFFDRQILPAVQEKIRKEWNLSFGDFGALGTAFILVYAVVGLPLGHWADRWRRKWILAGGVALWSAFTIGSGFAWNFSSLFVLRMGVGVGEASCAPAANSLIGDLVPASWRARALGLFMLGLPLGLALSFIVSATIADLFGWQAAFYVAGVPGLLLAVAALFIADPIRGAADKSIAALPTAGSVPFVRAIGRVLRLPTMWWIIASGALHNFNMYGLGTFLSSYLQIYHGITGGQAGRISGLVYGLSAFGMFGGGWLGDRAFRRRVSGRLHVAWIGVAGAIPCLLIALAAPPGNVWQCAVWLFLTCLLLYTYYGTVYATIQDIIEPSLRGTTMAIYFCAMYLCGAALGPTATGRLGDYLARQIAAADGSATVTEWHKALGLHQAMYLIPLVNAVLVVVLFAASRTVTGDYLREQKRKEIAAQAEETERIVS